MIKRTQVSLLLALAGIAAILGPISWKDLLAFAVIFPLLDWGWEVVCRVWARRRAARLST